MPSAQPKAQLMCTEPMHTQLRSRGSVPGCVHLLDTHHHANTSPLVQHSRGPVDNAHAPSQHAASRGWPCAHACMRRHPGVVCLQLCKDASVPVQPCAVTIVPRWCDAAAPPSRSRQTVPRGSNQGRVAALTCSGRARALAVWFSD